MELEAAQDVAAGKVEVALGGISSSGSISSLPEAVGNLHVGIIHI